jgi:endo-1,4-beta-xylanase
MKRHASGSEAGRSPSIARRMAAGVWAAVAAAFALSLSTAAAQAPADSPAAAAAAGPSLSRAYARHFAVGVALGGDVPGDYTPDELALVRRHFAILTPANSMKMDPVQREPGKFDFAQADAFVAFAKGEKLAVVGHTLVWARDDTTPAWMFRDGDHPAGRELLLRRMREHIEAVAGRYRGAATQWDVVNEALDDAPGGYLRPSGWLSGVGPDFVAKAFEYARAADPDAVLIYNDYLTEQPAKRQRMLRLLRELLAAKAPIDAVGLQGHFELDQVPLAELDETLTAIGQLGLKAMITELDVAVVPRGRWFADGGKHRAEMAKLDPYKNGLPPEMLERQAAQYAALFRLFRKHAAVIERVTFWDLHDGRSWLNEFPWKHTEHPLLFDRTAAPKPAFAAVIRAAEAE